MILFRRSCVYFLLLFGAVSPAFAGSAAAVGDIEIAALSPSVFAEDANKLSGVLSEADADRYQRIFAMQGDGGWQAADKLIAALDDRILLGHVMAQRYLHPTKYRSSYKELREWMDNYADLPHASEIYKLALTRQPKNSKALKSPVVFALPQASDDRSKTPATRTIVRRNAEASWMAGLASWRLQRHDEAARHFEAVAKTPGISPWMVSAGAFWAARSHLVGGAPAKYNPLLGMAAEHPRTFYGLLARRLLGLPMPFRWSLPDIDQQTIAKLYEAPAGRRAVALLQAGMTYRAELELRNLSAAAGEDVAKGILTVAVRTGMSSLAGRLDARLFPNGGGYDGAAYPLPDWGSEEEYSVDRALVYALIRQESQFNPKAKSRAGASGLMQLMPRTASFVARDRLLRGSKRHVLFDPEVNLKLGQKYVQMLLSDDAIKGDLFLMTAAWNGGIGNLGKWRRKVDDLDDSLFFIETLPSRETRDFIERVLTNLWIYRDQLGQAAHSLDAIATGRWPLYIAQDKETLQMAENGEDKRRAEIPAR